jgi:hypothetical protein
MNAVGTLTYYDKFDVFVFLGRGAIQNHAINLIYVAALIFQFSVSHANIIYLQDD